MSQPTSSGSGPFASISNKREKKVLIAIRRFLLTGEMLKSIFKDLPYGGNMDMDPDGNLYKDAFDEPLLSTDDKNKLVVAHDAMAKALDRVKKQSLLLKHDESADKGKKLVEQSENDRKEVMKMFSELVFKKEDFKI